MSLSDNSSNQAQEIKKHKTLSVCIIGKPNAGKSTLLNSIIGQKLSIVTPKVQTTRTIITGILTVGDTQLILFDTPGIFEPKKRLEKAMVRCAWSSLNNADIVVLIIDSSKRIDDLSTNIIQRIVKTGKKIVFLMNKIDLKSQYFIEHIRFLDQMDNNTINKSNIINNHKVLSISATTGQGIEDFLNYLKNNANYEQWLYNDDDITNLPSRFLAAEITREHLFLQLQQELPYNLSVHSEIWEEKKNGSVKIHQVILVSRDSYKNMIIGKRGAKIKNIGISARIDIEELIGKKIHLFLFVKVHKNWDE